MSQRCGNPSCDGVPMRVGGRYGGLCAACRSYALRHEGALRPAELCGRVQGAALHLGVSRLCDCGAPAVTSVIVEQLRLDHRGRLGKGYWVRLSLCERCAVLEA